MAPAQTNQYENGQAAPYGRYLVLFLAGLLLVRLFALYTSKTNLFFDEAQYWAWSRDLDFGYFSKPPVIAWIIRAATESCGMHEYCVRLASPLLHSFTALFVYLSAQELYDTRTGFWSGLAFATLPGVSFSAGLISTDVPLLTFWSIALFAWIKLLKTRSWVWALTLGVSLGLGLLSKYAMIYFLASALLFLVIDRDARWIFKSPHMLVALFIAGLLITPNILWNLDHGSVTFFHTAANAKWDGSLIHPLKALEFFGAQFGVFGPILFAALIIIAWRYVTRTFVQADRLLLAFSIPIILLITTQAFLSRAHANWAAVAYPAATILVTATMIRDQTWVWLRSSLALHLFAIVVLALATALAGRITFPGKADPFQRILGWDHLAQSTRDKLNEGRFGAVLTNDRAYTAELLYYLKDAPVPILAWRPDHVPHDHFQLTRPFLAKNTEEPLLLVSKRPKVPHITSRFANVHNLGQKALPTGQKGRRVVYFFKLSGFKGHAAGKQKIENN